MECLLNLFLAVTKVTKESCCHGNSISRKNLNHIEEKEKNPIIYITVKTVLQ